MDLSNVSGLVLVQEEPRGPSQLVEIPVPAAAVTKVQLPDVQQLRSQVGQTIIIKALRVITDSVLTNGPTIGGPVSPLTELQKMTLTLYCEGWEKGQLIPMCSLIDVFVEGSGIPWRSKTVYMDNWKNVDWSKSYLQFANGTASIGTAYTVLLEVEYVKLDGNNQEIVGPS